MKKWLRAQPDQPSMIDDLQAVVPPGIVEGFPMRFGGNHMHRSRSGQPRQAAPKVM